MLSLTVFLSLKKTISVAFLSLFVCSSFSVDGVNNDENSLKDATEEQNKVIKIIRVTPSGNDVNPPSEIIVEFDTPMVSLSGKEVAQDLPITISPDLKGSWRWINDKTLSFTINSDSQPAYGQQYRITIKTDMASEQGQKLQEDSVFTFRTSDPRPDDAFLRTWKSPGMPVIYVHFGSDCQKDFLSKAFTFVEKDNPHNRVKAKLQSDVWVGGDEKIRTDLEIADQWLVEPDSELELERTYTLVMEADSADKEGSASNPYEVIILKTFPEFKVMGVQCQQSSALRNTDKKEIALDAPIDPSDFSGSEEYEEEGAEKRILIAAGETSRLQKCNPMAPVSVQFSTPVMYSDFEKNASLILKTPEGKSIPVKFPERVDQSRLEGASGGQKTYSLSLPYGLKADREYVLEIGFFEPESFFKRIWNWFKGLFGKGEVHGLRDEFGRLLTNPSSIIIPFDHRAPNFVLPYREAMLEKDVDSDIPLYVNNLRSAKFTYDYVTAHSNKEVQQGLKTYEIPIVEDIQFAIPMEIRACLEGKSGVVSGSISTDPYIPAEGRYVFQVTPFHIQAKFGKYNTLVWITDLTTGKPVDNATVTLYLDNEYSIKMNSDIISEVKTNDQGIAFLPGTDEFCPKDSISYPSTYDRFFIHVQKEDDMGLLKLSYETNLSTFSLSDGKVWEGYGRKYASIRSWGFTAQGIYKPGETIQYKLYVKDESLRKLLYSPELSEKVYFNLTIEDALGNKVHTIKDLPFSSFGGYSGDYVLPESSPVGVYQFRLDGYLRSDYEKDEKNAVQLISLTPFTVLISDFTPAPFKVSVETPEKTIMNGEDLTIETHARFHSGGAYGDASTKISAILNPGEFSSNDPLLEGYTFSLLGNTTNNLREKLLFSDEGKTSSQGNYKTVQKISDDQIYFGKITIEGSVQDDRGKTIASNTFVNFLACDYLVGLKSLQWISKTNETAKFKAILVDKNGKPEVGLQVYIIIEKKKVVSAKVKSAGNSYKTDETSEWVQVYDEVIPPPYDIKNPSFNFDFTPQESGDYRITAIVRDLKGREFKSQLQFYVTGSDFFVWGEENDFYLPLIPEKAEYAIGETAKILVKNPYPNAQALITVERGGVLDQYVQVLEGAAPVIEIPIKEDYLPNFYVSVSVFSPRVKSDKPLELGELDMGKPALKSGYIGLKVKDKSKQIQVSVSSDSPVYKPRDKVQLTLEANRPKTDGIMDPMEFAVVVLDEAVLDLLVGESKKFDPYAGFYDNFDLTVNNFTLLKTLVGRMKFEKKGANPGGGAGFSLKMRDLFKFVSYWNPSVIPDEHGKAIIEFEAPDNLTGWRVLVVAMTPEDKFGLGEGKFVVNRETEIRPSMANQVSEGDQFKAAFTVLNRSDKPRDIRVSIQAKGDIDPGESKLAFDEKISLEPHKRTIVELPLKAGDLTSSNSQQGKIDFVVKAEDSMDGDLLSYSIPVKTRRVFETTAFFNSLDSGKVHLPISITPEMNPHLGGLSMIFAPTMLTNLSGAFKYMKNYPYGCWEQKLSRSVVASSYSDLSQYLSDDVSWDDSKVFTQNILSEASHFQSPNGGMTYFVARNEYADPFLSAFTAVAFGWLEKDGYSIDKTVEEKLIKYLDGLLERDVYNDYYTPDLVATIRALILEAKGLQGTLTIDDIQRYYPHVNRMGVFGRASFLRAVLSISNTEEIAENLVKDLLGFMSETATKITWSADIPSGSTRILDTPLRDNCVVLDGFVEFVKQYPKNKLMGDKPSKLVKAIDEGRKSKTHWENTQENLYCTRALNKYSGVYEKDQPKMDVIVKVGKKDLDDPIIKFQDFKNKPKEINIPMSTLVNESPLSISVEEQGKGRLYFTSRLTYVDQKASNEPVSSGFDVRREYSILKAGKWERITNKTAIQKGDKIRVDLFVTVPGDRNFVVVDDHVPGCLEPIDRKLATSSVVDASQLAISPAEGSYLYDHKDWIEFNQSYASFYYQELRHDSVRFYSDYLKKGNYFLSYVAQVIAEGTFSIAPCLVQEMYNPETYGRTTRTELMVEGERGE